MTAAMDVIPAIDLKDGRCVRLYQGDFDRETHYSDDPVAVAQGFETMGLRRLHVVDLDGARTGTQENRELIREIARSTALELQLGGGIRSKAGITAWLDAGVTRCIVGSIAIAEPETVADWLATFGSDRIVLALDVRFDAAGIPMLTSHGWTKTAAVSLWGYLDRQADRGLRHVLCTDVGRDGAMSGPNLALYEEFRTRYPALWLQASGGVRHVGDLQALARAGARGAVTGRALLDGTISQQEIASFLRGE